MCARRIDSSAHTGLNQLLVIFGSSVHTTLTHMGRVGLGWGGAGGGMLITFMFICTHRRCILIMSLDGDGVE